jgi:hypothetical protein
MTGFMGVIDSDHAYIHKGLAFTLVVDLGSISTATKIGFITPTVASGKYIHWRPVGIQTSANYVKYKLYEGDAFTEGVAATPINRNRTSSNTTKIQASKTGVTVTPAGTVLQIGGVGISGNPSSRAGGGAAADQELLLKQNTSYVLELDPAGATVVTLELFWYEED